ncbi:hypothetical protein, partial [Salmonella sp. E392-1]|uniref:hypothetical protein n=1 Tax=Salmonella sp. E392-1 TaxID=3240322 RepID=UPI00352A5701
LDAVSIFSLNLSCAQHMTLVKGFYKISCTRLKNNNNNNNEKSALIWDTSSLLNQPLKYSNSIPSSLKSTSQI